MKQVTVKDYYSVGEAEYETKQIMETQQKANIDGITGSIFSFIYSRVKDRTTSPMMVLEEWSKAKPKLYQEHRKVISENAPLLLKKIHKQLAKVAKEQK